MYIDNVLKAHGVNSGFKSSNKTLAMINQSIKIEPTIVSIIKLKEHIYVGATYNISSSELLKIDTKTMDIVGKLTILGTMGSLTTDGEFIYIGNDIIHKINPNTMTEVSKSLSQGYSYITYYNGYIYSNADGYKLVKIDPVKNYAVVASITPTDQFVGVLGNFNGYIYGRSYDKILKIHPETMSWIATPEFRDQPTSITFDEDYLYVNIYYHSDYTTLKKINQKDMSVVGEMTLSPNDANCAIFVEGYLYTVKQDKMIRINPNTLSIDKQLNNMIKSGAKIIFDGKNNFYCSDCDSVLKKIGFVYYKE